MTTRDPSRFMPLFQALARRSGLFLLLGMLGGGTLAGCGDSNSTQSDPFEEYEGVWAIDTDNSSLDCGPGDPTLQDVPFSLWSSQFTIAAGVLTDLTEVQGACQLNYDVDTTNHIATLANPDPYTGAAPTCTLTFDSSTGENAVITPITDGSSALTFKLLQPVPDAAPPAQIVGSADVSLKLADSVTGALQTFSCKFTAQVLKAHKIAKP